MVASVEVCCVDLRAAAVVSVSFIFASGVDGGVVVAGALLVFTQGKVDCRVDLKNNVVLVPLLGGVVVEGALFVCDGIVVVLVSFLLAVVMLGVVIWSATLEQKRHFTFSESLSSERTFVRRRKLKCRLKYV